MNRLIGGTGLIAACFLCWGIRSRALEQDVILKAEDHKVEVSMGGSEDTAVSMRLSLEVEMTEGDAEVSFEFAPGIESTVKQYRYEKESGILNLYVSGNAKQKIFQTEEFSLGKVVLAPGSGGSAAAVVRVKEDSLEIVNDAYDRQQGRVNASPEQKISVGTGANDPEPEEENPEEENPDDNRTEDPSVSEPEESGSESSKNPGSSEESGSSGNSGNSGSSGAGSSGQVSDSAKGKLSLESRHSEHQDVGIRSGTAVQTADAQTGPDAEQETLEKEPKPEETDAEEAEPEMILEPEELPVSKSKSGPDVLLLAGMAAGLAAAGIVICLMVLEYRRSCRKNRKKKKGTKRAARPEKEKRPKSGKKAHRQRK